MLAGAIGARTLRSVRDFDRIAINLSAAGLDKAAIIAIIVGVSNDWRECYRRRKSSQLIHLHYVRRMRNVPGQHTYQPGLPGGGAVRWEAWQ
jgi:hypothetical protein